KQKRLGDDCACKRDALALAARKLSRLAVEKALNAEHLRRPFHLFADLTLGHADCTQRERDVPFYSEVGVEGIALEHHCYIACARRQVRDHLAIDCDVTFGRPLESGNQAHQCRLPQPEGPNRTRNSPSWASKLIPSTACTWSKSLVRFLASTVAMRSRSTVRMR